MISIYIIGIIISLIFSAYFAGSETVFFSHNKSRMQALVHRNNRGARVVDYLTKKPERYLITILIGNNVSNVLYSSLMAIWLTNIRISEKVIFVFTPLFLLVFGEVVPKALGRQLSDRIVIPVSYILRSIRFVLSPVVKLVEFSLHKMQDRLGYDSEQIVASALSRSEVSKTIIDGGISGELSKRSVELASRAMRLGELRLADIMTPRTSTVAVEITADVRDVIKKIEESGFSRIVCYRETIDNISGVVYAKDLLKLPVDLRKIIRPILTLPETLPVVEFLPRAREKGVGIAAVIDEFGGFAGIITDMDVAQELVGEIHDEYDLTKSDVVRVSSGTWIASGALRIGIVAQVLSMNINGITHKTLGGLVNELAGRIPRGGDEFSFRGYTIRVIKADPSGVRLLRVTRRPIQD